jgi:hypothetical protein
MIAKLRATPQSTISSRPGLSLSSLSKSADRIRTTRAIARTLNARYQNDLYGLGPDNAATTYPVSAFVTHLVYLRDCAVHVNVTVASVRLFLSQLGTWKLILLRAMIGTWGQMHRGGERGKRSGWDSALRCGMRTEGNGANNWQLVVLCRE